MDKRNPRALNSVLIAAALLLVPFVLLVGVLSDFLRGSGTFYAELNRWGLLLQFMAGLSIVPQLFGKPQLAKALLLVQKYHSSVRAGKYIEWVIVATIVLIGFLVMSFLQMGMAILLHSGISNAVPMFAFAFAYLLLIISEVLCLSKQEYKFDSLMPHYGLLLILIYILSWYQLPTEKLIARITFPLFVLGTILSFISSYYQ